MMSHFPNFARFVNWKILSFPVQSKTAAKQPLPTMKNHKPMYKMYFIDHLCIQVHGGNNTTSLTLPVTNCIAINLRKQTSKASR